MLFALFLLSFLSCKKEDEDGQPPEITIITPAVSASFTYPSVIQVEVRIRDNRKLTDVFIHIVDASNQVYLNAAEFRNIGKQEEVIQHSFQFDDEKMLSGVYYINVSVFDGTYVSRAFREISLNGAPKEVERTLVIRRDASSTSVWQAENNTLIPYPDANFTDYDAGDYSSLMDYSCVASSDGSIRVFREDYFDPAGSLLQNFSNEETYTTAWKDETNETYWMAGKNGALARMNAQGILLYATSPGGNQEEIVGISANNEHVVCIGKNTITGQKSIQSFFRENLVLFQSTVVSFDALAVLKTSNPDQFLLIGNENGQAEFRYYYSSANAVSNVFFFYNSSPVVNAWPGPGGRTYVAHASGISVYSAGMNTWTETSLPAPSSVRYNEVSGEVILIYPDHIDFRDADLQTQSGQINASDIRDVWVIYNK